MASPALDFDSLLGFAEDLDSIIGAAAAFPARFSPTAMLQDDAVPVAPALCAQSVLFGAPSAPACSTAAPEGPPRHSAPFSLACPLAVATAHPLPAAASVQPPPATPSAQPLVTMPLLAAPTGAGSLLLPPALPIPVPCTHAGVPMPLGASFAGRAMCAPIPNTPLRIPIPPTPSATAATPRTLPVPMTVPVFTPAHGVPTPPATLPLPPKAASEGVKRIASEEEGSCSESKKRRR